MADITPKEIFDTCSELKPGFTFNNVEVILGLNKNSLQRLFNTGGFRRRESGGFELVTTNYDTWAKLCGLLYTKRGQVTNDDPVYAEFRATGIETVVSALRSGDLNELRDHLLSGTFSGGRDKATLKYYKRAVLALLYCFEVAENDPRYQLFPESVWTVDRV